MNIISTTKARELLPKFINSFKDDDISFVFGRRDVPEAILIKFPTQYSDQLTDITNVNAYSSSFDFLNDEPDIYTLEDILK